MRASVKPKIPTPYVQSVQSAFRLLESLHTLKRASLSQLLGTHRLQPQPRRFACSPPLSMKATCTETVPSGTVWGRNCTFLDRAPTGSATLSTGHDLTCRSLSGLSGETVLVSVPVGLERMIVAQAPSTHSLQVSYPIGSCVPLYVGGMGVAMLAFLPETAEQVLANPLTAFTEQTLDRPRLVAELARVRMTGVRVSVDDYAVGEFSIAAPILGGKNRAEAAITIAGFTARLDDKKREIYTVAVKEAADTLSCAIH